MKLMYVALTRPEDYLFITHSEPSSFIDRIVQSGKCHWALKTGQ
jgi:superfamily I DNA/RNA helicase